MMNSHYKIFIALLFILYFIPSLSLSQEKGKNALFTDDYQIDPSHEGQLLLSIDNLSFFKDNEFDGDIIKGYTLPGFRFQPRVIFYPSSFAKLEAGVSLLTFWGADKYPCYSYQNIAEWKSDSYTTGFHIMPFFRAQLQPSKQVNVILGTIYGGNNHDLIEPLYNPELSLTADPECGIQFLYDSRVANLDLWVNWESFIFKNDTHDEALTLGISSKLNITDPNSFFALSIPLQGVLAHRGGEIDTVSGYVQTLTNCMSGLNFKFNVGNRGLKSLSFDVIGAGYKELNGHEMRFGQGWAIYSNLTAEIWYLKFKAAYWRSSDYVNIFGNPIFGNMSLPIEGRTFVRPNVYNGGISYEQPFGKGIYLGADTEFFYMPNLKAVDEYGNVSKISNSVNFSVGVYLRVNPSIFLTNIF